MKKTYFWLLSSLFVGAFTFVSCSSDDDEDGGNTPVETPDPVNYEKTGGEGTITLGDGSTVNVTVPKLSNENVNGVFIVDTTTLPDGVIVATESVQDMLDYETLTVTGENE